MGDGCSVRRFDDGQEVVFAEQRVLGDHLTAHLFDLGRNRIKPVGILVDLFEASGREFVQQDEGGHGEFPELGAALLINVDDM